TSEIPVNSPLKAKTRKSQPQNQHPPIKETLERKASSPAAPPPSSVIGLIDPSPFPSQQPISKNYEKIVSGCF
ncbi:hypothetical protein, partial [Sinorhizobium medicae]|uniref:hypothetical protein n=2 Tax=Sinorhizobium medicae TaxID=110321 RepID=UPI001AECCFCD